VILRRWSIHPAVRVALMASATARLLVAAAWVGSRLVVDHFSVQSVQLHQGLFAWDGAWYRSIAESGYGGTDRAGLRFFPLYPWTAKVLSLGITSLTPAALLVVANALAVAALVLLHVVVTERLARPDLASTAVWVMALFPGAFVLGWAYAEPMLLAASLALVLALHRRAWVPAALFGVVAAAARPTGALLAVLVAVEALGLWRAASGRERLTMAAATVAPAVGLSVALVNSWVVDGEALAPLRIQEPLRGHVVDPVTRLFRALHDAVGHQAMADGLHAPFAVGLVALVVISFWWLPRAWSWYSAATIAVALAADNLNSLERYGLAAFPLVVVVAYVMRRWPVVETPVYTVLAGGTVALAWLAWLGIYVP
jgi:hypothetical protein